MVQVPEMQRTAIIAVCAFALLIASQQVSAGVQPFIDNPAMMQEGQPTYGNIVVMPLQPNVRCPFACSRFSENKLRILYCAFQSPLQFCNRRWHTPARCGEALLENYASFGHRSSLCLCQSLNARSCAQLGSTNFD